MAISLSGRLAPNVWKPFGSASVTTAIQPVWTPASGKVVRLMGFDGRLTAGAITQVDLTDGTAAASGTIATYPLSTEMKEVSFGAGKSLTGANTPLGIKARAGAGTISGTFYGREDTLV